MGMGVCPKIGGKAIRKTSAQYAINKYRPLEVRNYRRFTMLGCHTGSYKVINFHPFGLECRYKLQSGSFPYLKQK